MEKNNITAKVKIILVRPSHPGNIGGVARAMKTMGFSKLCIVAPLCDYPSAQTTAYASNASDVLDLAVVEEDISSAISDCHLVLGATARPRRIDYDTIQSNKLGYFLAPHQSKKVAIIFGSERNGLTNEELNYCQHLLYIPSNPEYCSLNLAQAVQIVCYELFIFFEAEAPQEATQTPILAGRKQMEVFYQQFETALKQVGFYHARSPVTLMPKIRRLFDRAHPNPDELNMLQGMLRYFREFTRKK